MDKSTSVVAALDMKMSTAVIVPPVLLPSVADRRGEKFSRCCNIRHALRRRRRRFEAASGVLYALLYPLHGNEVVFLSDLVGKYVGNRPSQDRELTAASTPDHSLHLRIPEDGPEKYQFLKCRNNALLRATTHKVDKLNWDIL